MKTKRSLSVFLVLIIIISLWSMNIFADMNSHGIYAGDDNTTVAADEMDDYLTESAYSNESVMIMSVSGTYTVSFNANGGNGTMPDQTITVGVATVLSENTFTKSGYVFEGWATDRYGEIVYEDEALVNDIANADETITLYAQWKRCTVKIDFQPGKLTAVTDPEATGYQWNRYIMSETDYPIISETTLIDGEIIGSYGETDSEGNWVAYDVSDDTAWYVDILGNEQITGKVKITLNGELPEESSFKAYSYISDMDIEPDEISGNTYIWNQPEGIALCLYATAPDGTTPEDFPSITVVCSVITPTNVPITGENGETLTDGDEGEKYTVTASFKDTSKTSTYRIFSNSMVTVSFDANGGSGTIEDIILAPGEEYRLPFDSFEAPEGLYFKGWNKGETGEVITVNKDITIKPIWGPLGQDYAIHSDSIIYVQDVLSGVADVTEENGVIKIKLTSDIHGRLDFDDNSGRFLLDLNGKTIYGSNRPDALCFNNNFDGTVTITGDGEIRTGYNNVIYKGSYATVYFTVAEGNEYFFLKDSNKNIFDEKNTTDKEYTICYGTGNRFVLTQGPKHCTVSFDANGGSGEMANQTTIIGDATMLSENTFSRDGYEFIGWATSPTGAKIYDDKETVSDIANADETITLYAKWVQGKVSEQENQVYGIEVNGLNNIAKVEETDIKLVVQTEPITEDDTEQTAIKGIADAPNSFNFYDITLEKSTGGYVTDATSVIEIKLPYDFSRKTNLKVYRYHNGIPEELAQLEARATAPYADGKCFIDATNNCIYIYSLKFSTYAVAYDPVRSSSGGGVTLYTVKFDTDGGSEIASKTVTRNSKIAEPTVPEKEGYTFMGWFTEESLTVAYDFDSKVTKSITLYAKWEKVDEQESEDLDIHNCPSKAFDDLDVNAWYHEDADYVIENGIFKGVGETTFAPSDKLTRAMLVTVLYRMENEPATNRSIPFSDVDMGAYYANAISWAKQNGIVNGVTENEFAPNDYITREQIATIMMRYAVYKGMDAITLEENLHFADADEISEYAVSSMNWAVGKGLINGKSESTLAPKDNATRIEVAAILHRFVGSNK